MIFGKPGQHGGRRERAHRFGNRVGIQNRDHTIHLNGFSRTEMRRGGIFKSTPPSGAKRRRMASPILTGSGSGWARQASSNSRTSCSMERPLRAARMRSRRLVFSGSFRTVMLAMQSMIAPMALIAHLKNEYPPPSSFSEHCHPRLIAKCASEHFMRVSRLHHQRAKVFPDGNPLIEMASYLAAELQRPYPGLTERRGVGGGSPRFAVFLLGKCASASPPVRSLYPIK